MVRPSRRRVIEQNENVAPNTAKSLKSKRTRTQQSDKLLKTILCDKTNINSHSKGTKTVNKTVKGSGSSTKKNKSTGIDAAKAELNSSNNISDSKVIPKRKNGCVVNSEFKLDKNVSSSMINIEPEKKKVRSNKKGNNISAKDGLSTTETPSIHSEENNIQPFLNVEKSTWDKFEETFSKTLKEPTPPKLNKQTTLPIYRMKRSSLFNKKSDTVEDRLNLYEFEVDENEPIVKKSKRKPILKFKKYRAKKNNTKTKTTPPLNVSNQENICPNTSNEKIQPMPLTYSEKIPDFVEPDAVISNNSVDNGNTSIDYGLTRRYITYSPKPYQSPMRESLNVPILRASISQTNLSDSGKSPFMSRSISSPYNVSVTSHINGHLISPMYLGSSTPIRCHWAEQSNANNTECGNFDLTNNFGFEVNDNVEEPFVSPIKTYETPAKPVNQPKASPVRIPHTQVIKMLKFGSDAPESTKNEKTLEMDELLPTDFFRDGDSPSFSPPSSPLPIEIKKCKKKNQKGIKKQVTIKEHLDDSDFVTQLFDKTNLDITTPEQTTRATRSNQHMLKENSYHNLRQTRRQPARFNDYDTSETQNDKVFDIEEMSRLNQKPIAKPRRSYERPPYLQGRRKFEDHYHHDSDEEVAVENETIIKPKKKKNDLSKKEQQELDKWAKAFNEQCMQVESFSLVVE